MVELSLKSVHISPHVSGLCYFNLVHMLHCQMSVQVDIMTEGIGTDGAAVEHMEGEIVALPS